MSTELGDDDDFIPGRTSSKLIDHPYRFNIFFFPLLGKVIFGPLQESECPNTPPVSTLPQPAHPFHQLTVLNGEPFAPSGWPRSFFGDHSSGLAGGCRHGCFLAGLCFNALWQCHRG